jgi:hypothetical protein
VSLHFGLLHGRQDVLLDEGFLLYEGFEVDVAARYDINE